MNFIDLCAGIGGFRLGLEQAGHKCVGFCEFDKFALKSYKAIHDTEGEWEGHDITKITDDDIRKLAAERTVDIICGGFPCQAFSVAGKRKGFSDTRGTIFFDICRFIRIIHPRFVVCENVKGLLSHEGGRTFGIILQTLAELGYCVEWQILNSKNFGVPQNRERVFIVGHFGAGGRRKVFPITGAGGENPCKLQEITHGLAQAHRVYNPENGLSVTLSSLGGGLGAKTGLYLTGIDLTTNNPKQTEIARCLQARYNKGYSTRAAECTGVMVAPVLTPDRVEKRQNGRRIKNPGEPMFTLTVQDRHGIAIIDDQGRKNKKLEFKNHVPTLRAQSHGNEPKVINGVRIRKLTPRECWHLQGFPDDYFDRAKAAGISDSQLYKQAGNAVTVNVAAAIGSKLAEIEEEKHNDYKI